MKKNVIILSAIISIILVGWYVFQGHVKIPIDERPVIGVTIAPLASIAHEILGDAVRVVQLVPSGASPHTFEPSPTLVARAQRSDVVFYIGEGLDNWIIDAAGSEAYFVEVSAGIDLHQGGHRHDKEDDHYHDHEEEEGFDPHYWLSFTNAGIIATNITTVMSERYPVLAAEHDFAQRLSDWQMRLKAVATEVREALADVDEHVIITFHDGWRYFAEDLGFEVGATFEPFPGREPSPAYIAQLQEVIRTNGVTRIYSEPQLASTNLQALITDLGIELRILDPLGSEETTTDYIELLRYNALQLR